MKKTLKWILRITITLVLLVVILALALKFFVDPNDYKEEIQTSFEDTIGRSVEIKGSIEWSLFPWLAISLNDVSVANEKGFKGESLAEINQFAARVKIIPLFAKNIEVGKIVIDEGSINLQVSKNGKSNWQSILDHLDSSSETQVTNTDEEPSGSLKIEGIEFKNINLNYIDTQAKTTVNITDLDFITDNITDGKSVNMQASMHVFMPDSGLDVDVNTGLVANDLLSEAGSEFFIKELKIEGVLSSESKMPLIISLDKEAKINLAQDTLTFLKVMIEMGEARISTNIDGTDISGNMTLQGAYQIDEFDFNQFVTQLTGSPLVNNEVMANFNSRGNWLLEGDRLKLDDLQLAYAKTEMKGSVDIKNLDQLKGNFDLHINQLNVDDFMGDESSATSSETASSNEMDFGRLSGSVEIDQLTASGTKMDNIKMKLQTNGSKLSISPVRADFYKGLLKTEILVDTKLEKNRVQVEHKMEKIQAGPLLTDVMGSELMTGLGHFDMDVKIDKPFSQTPLKTAHGRIDFSLGDGAIYGVDVFGMMNQGLSLLYPEVMAAQEDAEKKTTFALMKFIANIDQGILTTETLKVESPYLKIGGDITINLIDQTIDGTIEPMLIDIPDELVSDKYRKLLNLPIPVTLSGSLLEPKVKIDPAKLLLATQKKKIDKEKDKLKEKLFDSLFGKDKDEEEEGGN